MVRNGHSINFWLDNWYNDYPLSIQFPLVYAKTKTVISSLRETWNEGHIKLNLTHGASIAMHQEKSIIMSIFNSLQFTDVPDSALWLWEPTGCYTIKSLYNFYVFFWRGGG
jgi:hypothetical protein